MINGAQCYIDLMKHTLRASVMPEQEASFRYEEEGLV